MTMKQSSGIDLSHWNNISDHDMLTYDFVILKATEGTQYIDSTYHDRMQTLRQHEVTRGTYHYGVGGDPVAEARQYIRNVRNPGSKESLALDVESTLAKRRDVVQWCVPFAHYVIENTGIAPYIYINKSTLFFADWTPLVKLSCPLWLASYDETKPSGAWPYVARWQHTDKPYDLNIQYEPETSMNITPKPGPATITVRDATATPPDLQLTPVQLQQKLYNDVTVILRDVEAIKQHLGL